MNYDKILGKYFLTRSLFIKSKFSKIKYNIHKSDSKKCYIIISGWQMPLIDSFLVKKKLKKDNFLIIELPDAVLSSNPKLTLKIMKKADYLLHKKINYFKKRGVKEFIVVSSSLGTVLGTKITNEEKLVKKYVAISPAVTLSDAFWEGIETAVIRKVYEMQGYTKKSLAKLWDGLQPNNNMQNFKGKEVVVHLSEADIVVPYDLGVKFVQSAKKAGAKVKLVKNKKLGHILTLVKDYILGNLS